MEAKESQKLAKFFFLTLLDESLTISIHSHAEKKLDRVMSKLRGKTPASPSLLQQSLVDQMLVRIADSMAKKERTPKAQVFSNSTLSFWNLPSSLEMGLWQEFLKIADREEIHAVVWVHILKVPEADVAKGLKVTMGTLRHRLARGLKKLWRAVN